MECNVWKRICTYIICISIYYGLCFQLIFNLGIGGKAPPNHEFADVFQNTT